MPFNTLTFSPSFSARSRGGLALAAIVASLLLGCSAAPFAGSNRSIDIATLMEREQSDRELLVAGTIVQRVPLVGGMAYLLEDETGTVWVRTGRPLEDAEQQVMVRGALSVMDTGDRVLWETSRQPLEPETEN